MVASPGSNVSLRPGALIRSGLRHTCVLRTPYTSAIAPLAFLLFALAAIVAPGIQLQRRLGGGVDPALVLPIGFVFASAAYGAASVCGIPWVFVLLDAGTLRGPRLAAGAVAQGAVSGPPRCAAADRRYRLPLRPHGVSPEPRRRQWRLPVRPRRPGRPGVPRRPHPRAEPRLSAAGAGPQRLSPRLPLRLALRARGGGSLHRAHAL